MLSRAYAAALVGVDGSLVTVEADVRLGLPGLTLVGRASGAVTEARERVRSAIAHLGHEIRPRKQVVNLAPADQRKDSPGIDLAVACALLGSHEVVPAASLDRVMLWGELALDGTVRAAAGTLVVADCARRQGFTEIAVARASAAEAALVPGLRVTPVDRLIDLVAHLRGDQAIAAYDAAGAAANDGDVAGPDMADVRGMSLGRLAVEVMVAGGHNLLLHGPPGVGKTMLARRAGRLLPLLDDEAALEVTKIHSVANRRMPGGLIRRPPIRMPHHTVSVGGLLGGGNPTRPGEVSLAHRGLLFLDELLEFTRPCLEGMREPLEDGAVTIARVHASVRYPARFQLMAAMNPCPCGYLGHPERNCTCPSAAVERYQRRLSGPLLDRIDLVVPLQPLRADEIAEAPPGEPTSVLRERIDRARAIAKARLTGTAWRTNAEIPAEDGAIERLCSLDREAETLLRALSRARRLSPRAQHRLRRVARTIADLGGIATDAAITAEHVAQAASLRRLPDGRESGP